MADTKVHQHFSWTCTAERSPSNRESERPSFIGTQRVYLYENVNLFEPLAYPRSTEGLGAGIVILSAHENQRSWVGWTENMGNRSPINGDSNASAAGQTLLGRTIPIDLRVRPGGVERNKAGQHWHWIISTRRHRSS
ncbi:hypothetical protein RHA1_ro10153 (plasmid) [Rhodococcus jostii RHA1]|uniref:Uncharacterized protein n=1 Tax=Rhodococcus jostii (strain RHA1) TaxID=101510 RepID=Q0RWJ0_RHOJR|nr:hypothetical protein RHA1_ro10153 [Rhodococcus jostii RHA1]